MAAPTAGQLIKVGRLPGQRIGTDKVEADSATITTTETSVQDIVVPLVSGRTYKVTIDTGFTVSVATDHHFGRIREDSISGTVLNSGRVTGPTTAIGYRFFMTAEYTAVSTGNKTFHFSWVRSGGTGNIKLSASSTTPSFLHVDYARD